MMNDNLNNILTILLAFISLSIAATALIRTHVFEYKQFKISNINEFTNMWFNINKELLNDQTLWYIYDKPPALSKQNKPVEFTPKHDVFIYLHLNFFDLVFSFCHKGKFSGKINKELWSEYDNFIKYFFKNSSRARNLAMLPELNNFYSEEFLSYLKEIIGIEKLEKEINYE